MLNAIRYGFASFLGFSKPVIFFLLAAFSAWGVIYLTKQGVAATGKTLSILGAQSVVMNALVMFFISIPVAGQFSQEYRFKTLGATLLMVPHRLYLLISKTLFALIYVALAVGLLWGLIAGLSNFLGLTATGVSYSFLAVTGANFSWNLSGLDSLLRILFYVFGYMLIVISISVLTKIQALGVLIPMLYLLILESIGAASDEAQKRGFIANPIIPEWLRIFKEGQAWINGDTGAGLAFFSFSLVMFVISAFVFSKRSASA